VKIVNEIEFMEDLGENVMSGAFGRIAFLYSRNQKKNTIFGLNETTER